MHSRYGLYTYGVTGKEAKEVDITGIDRRHKVYAVAWEDLRVMVSEIDVEAFQQQVKNVVAAITQSSAFPQLGGSELFQAHEEAIESLMRITPIIPMKFGTILKDEQSAIQMLQDRQDDFQALLAKCSDSEEWGLKIYADEQTVMKHFDHEAAHSGQKAGPQSKGMAYLLGMKRSEEVKNTARQWLAESTERIFQELGQAASEAKITATLAKTATGKKQEMLLNAAYLLKQERVASFCEQGKSLQEHYASMGLEIELSGPWPPYNFT